MLKLNYNFYLYQFFILYLFEFLNLIFEVVKSDEDTTQHGKIM
jgi:hypothetical protein